MDTDDLGMEAANPFVLFLILILLLAANGAFERAVSFVQELIEAGKTGARPSPDGTRASPSRGLGFSFRNTGYNPVLGRILPLGVSPQNLRSRSRHMMLK
ncbi:MAG: hypothetical protein ACOX3V_00635 [Bacillota bacterium]|jgi:hypothetical protein